MAKTKVKAGTKDTTTANGAVSHSTSGKFSVDYFAKAGTYRDRSLDEVGQDLRKVWEEDPLTAVSIMFYLRTVTRTSKIIDGTVTSKVQKGQGCKDEFMKACEWLEKNHADTLYKNLWLIPATGCWKDLWYDSSASGYNHYINPEQVYELVKRGLQDEYNRALIAKYLPRIRSSKNIKNDRHRRQKQWALGLCKHLGWSPVEYRKFKADPKNNAHLWQRQMAKGLWNDIDFGKISGKALFQMVTARGKDKKTTIERHGLEKKYMVWLDKQPVAKFTGYVYELYKAAATGRLTMVQEKTYNKQFDGLIELAKKDGGKGLDGNVLCALDTSGSMGSHVNNSGLQAIEVCISLGIYFSALNEGPFKDYVAMFDATSRMLKLNGTFMEKVKQIRSQATAWGCTNFQSVIDEIIRFRKANPSIPVDQYPTTLLVVSDMQFDSAGRKKTNYEAMMKKLADAGLPKMNLIWWYVTGASKEVPNKADDEGVTIISGFDAAAVTLILGGEQEKVDEVTGKVRKLNAFENMQKALDQDIIKQLKV